MGLFTRTPPSGGLSSNSMTRPRRTSNSSFDISPIWRHPVFLVTFVMVVPAWMTAFIGMCVAEGELNAVGGGPVTGVLWFAIWLQLAVIIHLFLAIANNTLPLHRLQLCIVLAILIPFAVNGVQDNLYLGQQQKRLKGKGGSALEAVAVGWLLTAMVDLVWVLYLTSDPPSPFHSIFTYLGDGGLTHPQAAGSYAPGASYDRDMDLQHSSTRNLNPYGGAGGGTYEQAPMVGGTPVKMERVGNGGGVEDGLGGGVAANGGGGVQYAARAKALYAYSASPDDPNEVSFAKGEILDIVDSSGKWWQCRTSAGAVGIAPSNYLQLL